MTTDLRPVLFMLASTLSLSLNGLMAKLLSDSFSTEVLGISALFPSGAIHAGNAQNNLLDHTGPT